MIQQGPIGKRTRSQLNLTNNNPSERQLQSVHVINRNRYDPLHCTGIQQLFPNYMYHTLIHEQKLKQSEPHQAETENKQN
jgi:hypothetical protein